MTLRLSTPVAFKPKGLSDTADATNAFPGAMAELINIIPSLDTEDAWVCRVAAVPMTTFPGFLTPVWVTGMLVVGDLVYGLLSSQLNGGYDTPFVYDLSNATFRVVNGILNANQPFSPPFSGPWKPPILSVVGTRIMVAHDGFNGTPCKIGWFDISSFADSLALTTVAGSKNVTAGSNVLLRGWQPGMRVNGTGLPGDTTIVSIAAGGLALTIADNALLSATNTMTVTGGTPTQPLWGAGDTLINPLPGVPVSVKQMNGRAFYAVGAGVVISDALVPCSVTNANQAITFANGIAVTALGELPLKAFLTGGITQSIIAFQGNAVIQQITGDPALNTLTRNELKTNTGTLAPLSVVPTNQGLGFISPEGLRFIDATATVSAPVGRQGQGVCVPFINAVEPSRICGAANADTLRFNVQNGLDPTLPYEDYWYDIARGSWCGPHTFPAALIQPWRSSFIISPVSMPATLYRSDSVPTVNSGYVENGAPLTYAYKTSVLPDSGGLSMNTIQISTLTCALPQGTQLTVLFADDTDSPLDQVFCPPVPNQAAWGAFNWGAANWGANLSAFIQRQIPWNLPLTFKQGSFKVVGTSSAAVKLGNWYFNVQRDDYTLGR